MEKRQGKPYTSLYDFCKRMYGNELNRRAVESLIKAGAFDRMGVNRHSLVEAIDGIIKSVESDNKRNLDGQLDLFSVMSGLNAAGSENADSYEIKAFPEYSPYRAASAGKKKSAACTCPATRWTLTGNSRRGSPPTPSKR